MPRGSREQVLHWTRQPRFLPELLEFAEPVDCQVTSKSKWMPMGLPQSGEARLETFGPKALPGHPVWQILKSWWLAATSGNTPNWDIALTCLVKGKPGLILVEAKAHVRELDERGKGDPNEDSEGSLANHERIVSAIAEARSDLQARKCAVGSAISHERSYQLANRIAFAWKLASEGIPTVLLYLGFVGDREIANIGTPFASDAEWHRLLRSHLEMEDSEAPVQSECATRSETFWVMSRTRPAVSSVPAKA
jgi:hypothetical protein